MRNLIISLAFFFFSFSFSNAQIDSIPVGDDVELSLYAGILSSANLHIDDHPDLDKKLSGEEMYEVGDVSEYISVRLGVDMDWQMDESTSFHGMSFIENPNSIKTMLWVKTKVEDNFDVSFGYMPTVPAEQQPNLVSADGQFMFNAESQIAGPALGAKARYYLTSDRNVSLAAGVVYRDHNPEYSVGFNGGLFTVSGWWSNGVSPGGVTFTVNGDNLYHTFVIKDKTFYDCFVYDFRNGFSVYQDFGIKAGDNLSVVKWEAGLMKSLESKWVQGKIWLGYAHKERGLTGGLFVHI